MGIGGVYHALYYATITALIFWSLYEISELDAIQLSLKCGFFTPPGREISPDFNFVSFMELFDVLALFITFHCFSSKLKKFVVMCIYIYQTHPMICGRKHLLKGFIFQLENTRSLMAKFQYMNFEIKNLTLLMNSCVKLLSI